jgi:hypothetical protein
MSTIITRNSANSGSTPASLVQGELAINVTDGRLFYGSGSGNVVKEFTGSASGGTIDTGSFAITGSNTFTGDQIINGENLGLIVDASGLKRVGFMKYGGLEGSIARVANQNFRILRTTGSNINDGTDAITDFYIAGDGKVGIGTTSPAYTLDVSGSSNFTDGQTIVGNITFPSGSFISSTNISGNIYISTLNDGILHLNDDGGEGDVWMLNGQNKLRIEGDTIITGSIHQSGTFYPNQIDWFSSSIGYDTGSYILTTTANGLTTYANYQDVATIINSGLLTTSSFNAYTGSSTSQFAGTASYATNALSASYAVSASYEINYETSSSYADFAVSASHALNADNAISASYTTQAGNAAAIDIYSFSSPVDSYLLMSNVIATTGVAVGGDTDLRYNSSTNTLTAINISATSLTGSLLGTASYAATALSSSYALNATNATTANTASYVLNAVSASFATSASRAVSSSFATTASYYGGSVTSASYAATASYVLNAVSASYASQALSSSYALTASYVNPLNQNVIITGSIYIPDNTHGIYFSGSGAASKLTWNNTDGTLDLGLKGGNVTLQIGQEEVVRVVNKTGGTLKEQDYYAVRLDGAQGNRVKVALARGDSDGNSLDTLGLVAEDIAINQEGFVITTGLVRGIDTTGTLQGETWTDGDALYLSPTTFGALTNIPPTAPSHSVRMGYVVQSNPSNGSIYVKVDNGYELNELHNVSINTSSLSSGDLLTYNGSVWNNSKQLSGSYSLTGSLNATSFTGSLFGTSSWASNATTANTASYVLNAVSASFATSASRAVSSSFATTASYVLQAVSASFASTASYVNTLNQNVLITGSATIGAASLGASENTLTLGARDVGSEGGQLGLNAPGGTYTSASMLDNYANFFRILRGSNAGSDALVAQWNMHNKQMQLPAYNSPTAFTGTTLVGLLGFDNSGNLITTTTSSGGGGGGVTITNNVDNYVITATGTANTLNGESGLQYNGSSLSVTGQITSSGAIISNANGAMYFRGGDDAEFWDINVANTVGIYGQQAQGIGAVKLGSGGPTLYGSGSRLGIGTTGPVATVDINGNLYVASGITGSLQGTATTASYVLNAVSSSFATTASYYGGSVTSASYALTASYVLNAVSASFATLAQTANTASYVVTAQTASYVLNAVSASYATNALSSSFASTASYYGGSVTSASYALTASYANNSTSASYALNATTSNTASYVLNAISASYATLAQTANTASYVLNAVSSSYASQALSSSYALTSSYVATAQTASYVLNAVSASFATTASYVQNAQTASYVLQAVSASYATLSQTANTASYVVTAQTASYVQTAQTASYVLQAVSASFATTASYVKNAQTASYILNAVSASYATNTLSSSFALTSSYYGGSVTSASYATTASYSNTSTSASYALTASYVATAQTASYVLQAVSASFATLAQTANTASYVVTAQTASYVLNAVSASYASQALSSSYTITASYVKNAQTASYVLNAISSSFATTASYATQALSASWAPSSGVTINNNTDNYLVTATGTANTLDGEPNLQFDGSTLNVTGSFYASSSNGALTETKAFDVAGATSINFASRGLYDITSATSIDWNSKYLYRSGIAVVDWGNVSLNDVGGATSIEWNSRFANDSLGITSLSWGARSLTDSSGTSALNWDASGLSSKINSPYYFQNLIPYATQEIFSDLPLLGNYNYEGEAIGVSSLDISVALFDLVYLETDGTWYQVTQGTTDCSKLLGICVDNSPNRETVLLEGSLIVNDSLALDSPYIQGIDHGLPIYIRESGGTTMSTIQPSISGQYVRILGHAYYQNIHSNNYWIMKFRPSNNWYVI